MEMDFSAFVDELTKLGEFAPPAASPAQAKNANTLSGYGYNVGKTVPHPTTSTTALPDFAARAKQIRQQGVGRSPLFQRGR